MYQYYVGWLEKVDVLRSLLVVSMRGKRDVLHGELHVDMLVIYYQGFRTVHYLFSKSTFHRVASEHNTVLKVWSPFQEQIPALPVLEHTGTCHNDQWIGGFIIECADWFKFEWIIA